MHALQGVLDTLAGSWVFFVLLFGVVFIDSLIPVLPSELLVISAGALAAQDAGPAWWLILLTATAGATAGDHSAYALGRWRGDALIGFAERRPKLASALASSRRGITKHGALIILIARHIPVGRVATNLLMGSLKYPVRRFTPIDIAGSAIWAAYSTLIGYFGGEAVHRLPVRAWLYALVAVVVIAAVVVLIRRRRAAGRTTKT